MQRNGNRFEGREACFALVGEDGMHHPLAFIEQPDLDPSGGSSGKVSRLMTRPGPRLHIQLTVDDLALQVLW